MTERKRRKSASSKTADVPMADDGTQTDIADTGTQTELPVQDTPMPDRTDEEEDDVIAECDVYLNHLQDPDVFQGDLYMLQYPHRPIYRPNGDQGKLRHVDIDKLQKRLRLSYKLDTETTHYNKNFAHPSKEYVLTSEKFDNPNLSYCIAAVRDGKFVMTPVKSFLQCRAQMDNEDDTDDEDDALKDPLGQTEIKMNITTRRKKNDRPAAQKAVWEHLVPFDVNSKEAHCAYQHFVTMKEEEVEFKSNNADNFFIQRMCGTEMASDDADGGTSFLSRFVLSRMTLSQQLEAILWESDGAISTTQIRKRLAPQTKKDLKPEILLDQLLASCTCVRNSWVLKHEIVGFSDTVAKVRDSLLIVLHRNGQWQTEAYFKNFVKVVSKDVLLDIVKTVGTIHKAENGEEIITLPTNNDNIQSMFPIAYEKIEKSMKLQQDLVRNLMTDLRQNKIDPLNISTLTAIHEERLRAQIQHEVRVLLCTNARTVSDLQRLVQQRHPNQNISETLLKSVLSKATLKAGSIRSVWYLQNVGGRLDRYRQCVIRLFKENASITVDDLLEETRTAHLENPTDLELRQLLCEFATLDGDRWVFRE